VWQSFFIFEDFYAQASCIKVEGVENVKSCVEWTMTSLFLVIFQAQVVAGGHRAAVSAVTVLLLAHYCVRADTSFRCWVKSGRHRRCDSCILAVQISLGTTRVTVCLLTLIWFCKVGGGHMNVYKLLFTTSYDTGVGKNFISNNDVNLYVHFEQLAVLGII